MLIGFVGYPGCGRNTVCDHLARLHGLRVEPLRYPVEEMVAAYLGLQYAPDVVEKVLKPRNRRRPSTKALAGHSVQDVLDGVDAAMTNLFGANVWIDHLLRRTGHVAVSEDGQVSPIEHSEAMAKEPVLVPDVATLAEAVAVREHGFLIRLHGRTSKPILSMAELQVDSYRVDAGLANTGTVEDLRAGADEVYMRLIAQ